jgi:hypothetical protein
LRRPCHKASTTGEWTLIQGHIASSTFSPMN